MLLHAEDLAHGRFETATQQHTGPIELKIGIDTGVTLCRLAAANPETLFVGVEIKRPNAERAYRRAVESSLANVWVVNDEASNFIRKHCLSSSFSATHIYFPTPFPGALRKIGVNSSDRLITARFMDDAHRVLGISCSLRIITDVSEYFRMVESFAVLDKWLHVEWRELKLPIPKGCLVGTPTEVKYRRESREIYSMQLLKI